MRAQPLIAVLLIITMTTTAAHARTLASWDDPPVETNDAPLTPDEELEARAVAEQFISRFEGSNDLLSIVDDLYVRDFNDRLRDDVADRFIVPIASDLALQVKGDELRRCHIATLKFLYLYILIGSAWYSAHYPRADAEQEESEKEFNPMEALPARAIAVLKNDPAFAELILEASKSSSKSNNKVEEQAIVEGVEKKVEDRDLTIKDMERLRSYVSILEQAVAIMSEHLQTLPAPHTWQGFVDSMREPGEEPTGEPARPRVITLIYDSFGCPKGTRLICINVMDFHMELVRIDGQLKILSVNMGKV
jgi:hypothetical protein